MKAKNLITFLSLALIVVVYAVPQSVSAKPIFDGDGGLDPVDVCPNIDGVQWSIPSGLVKDGSGNCVSPRSWGPPNYTVGDITLDPSRPVVGGNSTFRLKWKTSGDIPDYCRAVGTYGSLSEGYHWTDEPVLNPRGGERVLALSNDTNEGFHDFGMFCSWAGAIRNAQTRVFLDKPVQTFISADAGDRAGVRSSITVSPGETVRINVTAINILGSSRTDYPIAECSFGGGRFPNGSFTAFKVLENDVWRFQHSYSISPPENATYTLACLDYFTSQGAQKGVQDSITVTVSKTQCSDGTDNDGDTLVDLADPGCSNDPNGNNEGGDCVGPSCPPPPACGQPGQPACPPPPCVGPACPPPVIDGCPPFCPPPPPPCVGADCDGGGGGGGGGGTQCSDGKDNDLDGKIDGADSGCLDSGGAWNKGDNNEFNFKIREIIPDFFNLNWFKLNIASFSNAEALAK